MLNNCVIMGNLVADPEVKKTPNGISYCRFRIACSRDKTPGNEKVTDFFDCIAWRKTGEFVGRYFAKGKPILLQGRMQMNEYTTNDGQKRRNFEIVVNNADFCGGDRVDRNAGEAVAPVEPAEVFDGPVPVLDDISGDDGELPF